MSFDADVVRRELQDIANQTDPARRYLVGFSGGLDSTVLLHALANDAGGEIPVRAIYVDHGLQDESARWGEHCRRVAERFGVDFDIVAVPVDRQSGRGLEAAARDARYSALSKRMRAGDWLLSAHHQDDQAETLLLNLMRSSGPDGLAGIARCRSMGIGWLARPLLQVSRSQLLDYARQFDLDWISDPSNLERRFDRNYLRHEVMPALEARWPDAARRIRRSASLAGEARGLLADLAQLDLESLGGRADRLPVDGVLALERPRQRNLLRYCIGQTGLGVPPAARLQAILDDLATAATDRSPLVEWPGGSARRYRGHIYLLVELLPLPDDLALPAIRGQTIDLPAGLGAIEFRSAAGPGIAAALLDGDLELRFRSGGEEFVPAGHRHTRKLKKLLQDAGVVPWMRDRLPLLFADGRLIAVADLWIAADACQTPGTTIHWSRGPELT